MASVSDWLLSGDAQGADRTALSHLVQTYCHAIDRRDYTLLRSLYHDDAIDEHGAMFCGPPDALVAWLPSMMANWQATRHSLSNMLFLIAGDEADGELQASAWHRTADGRTDIIAHGRYLDRYRRRGGVWRFWRRALVLDWMEERAVSAPSGTDDGVAHAQPGAGDPCYQHLPLFAAKRNS